MRGRKVDRQDRIGTPKEVVVAWRALFGLVFIAFAVFQFLGGTQISKMLSLMCALFGLLCLISAIGALAGKSSPKRKGRN